MEYETGRPIFNNNKRNRSPSSDRTKNRPNKSINPNSENIAPIEQNQISSNIPFIITGSNIKECDQYQLNLELQEIVGKITGRIL